MSAMPVSVLKNFLHALIDVLNCLPEQSGIRDILQKITDGEGVIARELLPTINSVFIKYDCLYLSADEALAIQNLDQLDALHRRAERIKLIQALRVEWETLIS